MADYRVHFFKYLLSSDGHPFKCRQKVIEIGRARSEARAMKAAQLRFSRAVHGAPWNHFADCCELEMAGGPATRCDHLAQ